MFTKYIEQATGEFCEYFFCFGYFMPVQKRFNASISSTLDVSNEAPNVMVEFILIWTITLSAIIAYY